MATLLRGSDSTDIAEAGALLVELGPQEVDVQLLRTPQYHRLDRLEANTLGIGERESLHARGERVNIDARLANATKLHRQQLGELRDRGSTEHQDVIEATPQRLVEQPLVIGGGDDVVITRMLIEDLKKAAQDPL